ncbi:MAG TPA: hypothetical protein VMW33_05955 [Ilumatobacteraceae bacterium]|nr:hypothetical protein [Ilumatobacteraceae bacterium]
MRRPLVIDTFPFFNEFDVLEMRLTEMADAVDFVIAVEADVTHQDTPKPYYLTEELATGDRFDRWKDKLIVVRATDLPTADEYPNAWARENAQREWIKFGFGEVPGLLMSDIVLQSDVDEIPRALPARNVRPKGFVAFGMRFHCWAVDWVHPDQWPGTVAGTVHAISKLGDRPLSRMRDLRGIAPCPSHLSDAGWHFTWLGGADRALAKAEAFAHPEVRGDIAAGVDDDLRFWRDGYHVDGTKLIPVNVDEGWPKWITEGHAPASWYRPRP